MAKRLFKSGGAVLFVTLVSIGVQLINIPTANAVSSCIGVGATACYYNGANYTSTRAYWTDPTNKPSGPCDRNLGNSWASSLFNNTIDTHYWYTGADQTGSATSVGPQSGRATLSATYNNNLRSWEGMCYGGVLPASSDSGVEFQSPASR